MELVAEMTATEALRVQLDNLQREKQQLEIENARLREGQPEQADLIDARAERDDLREQQRLITAETRQLRTKYEQLVRDARADQQVLEDLREELSEKTARVEELGGCCERMEKEAELERYRELEKERRKWELREDRMLQQLDEMQAQVQSVERRGFQDHLSYCGEEDDGSCDSARTRVTFGDVSETLTTNNHEVTPMSGCDASIATTTSCEGLVVFVLHGVVTWVL